MSQFSEQLKQLRTTRGYSMQQLADRANVSKSMISKIEREEVQPTLDIATRLAQALGKSLSSMLETQSPSRILKIAQAEQSVWEDPMTHMLRRVLSPASSDSNLEWLDITLPAKTQLPFSSFKKGSEKYVLVMSGRLDIRVNEQLLSLQTGDSGYFAADQAHVFINTADYQPVHYLLVIKH